MFVNLVGWVELVKLRSTFAKTDHAKTEEYAPIMRMLTTANALKATVDTTVNILDRFAIQTHANMGVPV